MKTISTFYLVPNILNLSLVVNLNHKKLEKMQVLLCAKGAGLAQAV
jgi:hypothetical protein